MSEERAFFTSALDAVRFSLNLDDTSIPGPVMNRAMAEYKAPQKKGTPSAPMEATRTPYIQRVQMTGTDERSICAGWVLQHMARLERLEYAVLVLTQMQARTPCSCGSPCCRGWRYRPSWLAAGRQLYYYFKDEAELSKRPGVRGFSCPEKLRTTLIEEYARPEDTRATLTRLAQKTEVSIMTVSRHRELIYTDLDRILNSAWTSISEIFDQVGITGDLSENTQDVAKGKI